MPNDNPNSNLPRNPDQERISPERSPGGDRNAQRGDQGSFGGDQPLRGDQDDNLDPNREPQRKPDQGSGDFQK